MEKYKISVIIPVYKVEKYLKKCIDSVITQDYQNLEIILVDDGSPDNCGKICDEYKPKDSRIIVVHQKNMGLSGARNTGLDISTGDFIHFIDSDDWIEPNLYSDVSQYFYDYNMIMFGYTYLDEKGNILEKFILENSFKGVVLNPTAWNKIYRKELFKDTRFPLGKIHEDQFITPIVYLEAKKIKLVKKYYYNYLNRENSIMNSDRGEKEFHGFEAFIYVHKYLKDNNYKAEFIEHKKIEKTYAFNFINNKNYNYRIKNFKKLKTYLKEMEVFNLRNFFFLILCFLLPKGIRNKLGNFYRNYLKKYSFMRKLREKI